MQSLGQASLRVVLGHFSVSIVHYVNILRTRLQQGTFISEGKLERIEVQVRICLLSISTKVLIASCIVAVQTILVLVRLLEGCKRGKLLDLFFEMDGTGILFQVFSFELFHLVLQLHLTSLQTIKIFSQPKDLPLFQQNFIVQLLSFVRSRLSLCSKLLSLASCCIKL